MRLHDVLCWKVNALSLEQSLTIYRNMDRLASLCLAHAGDWLNVIQSGLLGLHVRARPQEFRYSVLNSLGVPIYATDDACPACMQGQ